MVRAVDTWCLHLTAQTWAARLGEVLHHAGGVMLLPAQEWPPVSLHYGNAFFTACLVAFSFSQRSYRRHLARCMYYLKAQSHQTSSLYILQNGLKLCAMYALNVVQTSWMGYKLPGWTRKSRTLNLLKIFWRPSRSEPGLKNVVRTQWELVWCDRALKCEREDLSRSNNSACLFVGLYPSNN